ncbi:MAG: DegV family protein [Clostridia bacterium]|nr:DegV family protein [Clostridia bacterium]
MLEKYHITCLPLYITFGETSYRDGVEITPDELYKKVAEDGVMPKTSAISVGDFLEYFEKLLQEADQVVHFTLSSGLSCTYQNACLAAEDFPGKVFIVDSLNLSTGEALTLLNAAELLAGGASAEEIVEKSKAYAEKVDASFIVDNLEFLRKGGRCSALSALGANLLSIKPCIEVSGGKMDVGKKYRGKFKAVLQKYVEERLSAGDIDTKRIFVTHAGCADDVVNSVYQAVVDTGMFSEVLLTRAGCTISSHCGPDTLGILFAHN